MHFQYIHHKNTDEAMFTMGGEGLTSHSKMILDQINTLIDMEQKGLFFSYDMFCKTYFQGGEHLQTLNNKYQVDYCDIGGSEYEVVYDLIVIFGTFSRGIGYEMPALWKYHIEPKLTPVIVYTAKPLQDFVSVKFDEIPTRIRSAASDASDLAVETTAAPADVTSQTPDVTSQTPDVTFEPTPPVTIRDRILSILDIQETATTAELLENLPQDNTAIKNELKRLCDQRIIVRVRRGVYRQVGWK